MPQYYRYRYYWAIGFSPAALKDEEAEVLRASAAKWPLDKRFAAIPWDS